MTDEELAGFLCLTPEEAKIIIPTLTPEKRAVFDKMLDICMWDAGMIPLPDGVLVDTVRSTKRRRAWR